MTIVKLLRSDASIALIDAQSVRRNGPSTYAPHIFLPLWNSPSALCCVIATHSSLATIVEQATYDGVGSIVLTELPHHMNRTAPSMHARAIETIRRHVAGTLANCVLADGWPTFQSYYQHVESLSNELLKHKKDWIDTIDVYNIFITQLYNFLTDKLGNSYRHTGQLKALLDGDVINLFAEKLTNFYCSIPICYEIYLKLQSGDIAFPSVKLSNHLEIISFSKSDRPPWGEGIQGEAPLFSLMSAPFLPKSETYLKSLVVGYLNYNYSNQTVRRALANFKIALFQALGASPIRISNRQSAGLGLMGGMTHHSVEKYHIKCIEKNSNPARNNHIELPIDLSLFLSRLEIDDSKNSPLFHCLDEQRPELIRAVFSAASALIESEDENTGRIKSAIEWFIDAHTTENPTMSFLQICIALEAIFGDENGREEGLTRTLADRCAYLIGTSIQDRKEIRERFGELYKVRSKLVHGSITSLNPNEQQHLEWGMYIAKLSIQKEIVNLKLT